ncbi:cob(I)yrinic acid a,c-diamide adenosyltransferase [Methylobacterium sp. J-001]|uniref:cob(I)yrinic acid a,c-diamide adenosyltransferase n=1 Tax=Methylobacterium sp. J-001 TaxID=2836609 RepID=UPI001FB944E4|nr:cob(I)yrinic acid a,c-diamide adenosyltransferase [Methylobacterium sp. J-001]MCJ2115046.1 cob(I)yrinic acid a,c-diamide adenosyltransferase [Methylobacterium sp. J-001]
MPPLLVKIPTAARVNDEQEDVRMGPRLSKSAAGTGDQGQTGLGDGMRVDKDNPIVQTLGAVDELNSWIGVVASLSNSDMIRSHLSLVQHDLFDLGAQIGVPGTPLLSKSHLNRLEATFEALNREFELPREFILPGGAQSAAFAHVARTICRRAERNLFTLSEEADRMEGLPIAARTKIAESFGLPYLNRLSDVLFVVSRYENRDAGGSDVFWERGHSLKSAES